MVVGWSPFASTPSASVGSGTVSSESTTPWLTITVPAATPGLTVTRNVIVTAAPCAIGPTATRSSGAPLSSTVPAVDWSVPGTYVVFCGTGSWKTTPVTLVIGLVRTTVYSSVSPGSSMPPLVSSTVLVASTSVAAFGVTGAAVPAT